MLSIYILNKIKQSLDIKEIYAMDRNERNEMILHSYICKKHVDVTQCNSNIAMNMLTNINKAIL